jgi:hypothetical protein
MNALEIAQLQLGTASLIAAAIISASNAYIVLRYLRRHHGASFIPVIGGILGAIGYLYCRCRHSGPPGGFLCFWIWGAYRRSLTRSFGH